MGFSDRIDMMGQSLKEGSKNSMMSLTLLILKVVTGLMLALVLSLIFQTLFNLGQFSLFFLGFVFFGIFLRVSKDWSISKTLIFDLIAILVAVILRMYIYMAP